MALNDNHNNNNKEYQPTVYSAYKMSNIKSEVDKTNLNFSFWNSSLKISISPRKAGTAEDVIQWDHKNAVSIYLNHTKAAILASELRAFRSDQSQFNNAGVDSGQGLISISNGEEFGIQNPVIIIRRINASGMVESAAVYEFKTDYYCSIRNFTEGQTDFEKHNESYRYLEIDQLICLLEEYVHAMTYAGAYATVDALRFTNNRTYSSLERIEEKLGIARKSGAKAESFFNSGNSNKPTSNPSAPAPMGGYSNVSASDILDSFND